MVVHHIDVQPVRAGYRGGLVAQLGEVGGQNRRRDQRLRHVPHPTLSAAANMASVPCLWGHNCTYGPSPRSSTGSNSGRASSAVTGWRRSASATTPTVSTRCGEQVAYSTTPPGRVSRI